VNREVNGIKFWSYNAGHVLGAAMFMIEIAGVRCAATPCLEQPSSINLRLTSPFARHWEVL
jgi:cleavage and polyadenylation specificity factor subunit 3